MMRSEIWAGVSLAVLCVVIVAQSYNLQKQDVRIRAVEQATRLLASQLGMQTDVQYTSTRSSPPAAVVQVNVGDGPTDPAVALMTQYFEEARRSRRDTNGTNQVLLRSH